MWFRKSKLSNKRGDVIVFQNRFRWFSRIHVDVFAYASERGREFGYDITWPDPFKAWPGLRAVCQKGFRTCLEAKTTAARELKNIEEKRKKNRRK